MGNIASTTPTTAASSAPITRAAALDVAAPTDPSPARTGRPRRFETADELRILLDSALVVMERNGYAHAAVADILREADLSTRSFYRHFGSKDQLLCALFRREADAAATRLWAKVDAAASPQEALHAWIDEILSFGHDPTKAARIGVLGSPGAMKAEGYVDEMRHASAVLAAPLEALLRAGAADGSFPLADPPADAALIRSVVWAAADLNPARDRALAPADAARQVRSFCERALGAGLGAGVGVGVGVSVAPPSDNGLGRQ